MSLLTTSDSMRGSSFKLSQAKFGSDIRQNVCTERVARCWSRLLRELAESLLLEAVQKLCGYSTLCGRGLVSMLVLG